MHARTRGAGDHEIGMTALDDAERFADWAERSLDPNDPKHRDHHPEIELALVELAHAAGLLVHPWTFRNEPVHLAADAEVKVKLWVLDEVTKQATKAPADGPKPEWKPGGRPPPPPSQGKP